MTERPSTPSSRPLRATLVIGNPRAGSRTRQAAEALGEAIAASLARHALAAEQQTIELAEVAGQLFDWASPAVEALLEQVRTSDLLIVASPTYKATYTGLLKAFLDRVANDSLRTVTAVPVMIGGAPIHHLAVELHLRALLVELGASCPTRGLFLLESELPTLDTVLSAWLENEMGKLLPGLAAAVARQG